MTTEIPHYQDDAKNTDDDYVWFGGVEKGKYGFDIPFQEIGSQPP